MKSKAKLNHKHRRKTLKSRVLSLLLLMMILLMIISQNSNFFYQNNDDKIKEKSQYDNINKIKSGTAHNATYIYNNNFSALPSCTGSGAYSDPYVIKNLEIDGEDNHSCIVIEDSDAFFRIENCTLFNIGSLSSESLASN